MIYETAVSTWQVRGSNGSSTTFKQSKLEVREHKTGASLLVFWVHPEGGRRLIAAHEANWSFEEVDESVAKIAKVANVDESAAATDPEGDIVAGAQSDYRPK
ncbi:hypothetical protein E1281_17860 [Actinomadura sp. KC345]|uniref:hypothetical protein n=1 Tax=Actinomadura sp. KC345 TaxID=2530371 RepID=UPI0010440DCB|nr:hypothetical protein [Actinomadura sp. KC345]TDC53324.1 hypothetical protein E1281_17860 [Actinomadura sp. KC345]